MSFQSFHLDPRLQQGIRALGFQQPTHIQTATVPAALTGQDIVGSAETGTGKTAAYLLPILHRLLKSPPHSHAVRALVVVPTRELALQVTEQAEALSTGTGLRVTAIFGGVGMRPQEVALGQGTDIVIATPGRLLDHASRQKIDFRALQILVVDEADRMFDAGFLPDVRRIVRLLPRERQTMLFSATLPPEVSSLAAEVTRHALRIQVETAVTPTAITQSLFPVPEHLKTDLLLRLLQEVGTESVLIFTRTKHRADRVARQLARAQVSAAVIHGNRSQNQRIHALESFRTGQMRVLVATDIAARGIDVEGISHVINYDVPAQAEDYVHRIGRTGRAQATGTAYTLVTPADEEIVRKIEGMLKQKLGRRRLLGLDYTAPAPVRSDSLSPHRYSVTPRAKNEWRGRAA